MLLEECTQFLKQKQFSLRPRAMGEQISKFQKSSSLFIPVFLLEI